MARSHIREIENNRKQLLNGKKSKEKKCIELHYHATIAPKPKPAKRFGEKSYSTFKAAAALSFLL